MALEVLAILEEPGFLAHVRQMAGLFHEGLGQLAGEASRAAGGGPPAGVDDGPQTGQRLCMVRLMTWPAFNHGLLTIYANHDQSVNQLLPPLTIQEDEVAQVLEALDQMLAWLGEVA